MRNPAGIIVIILVFCSFSLHCQSQTNDKNMTEEKLINRYAVFAGQFYPGITEILSDTLTNLFSKAKPRIDSGNVLAVISPHAGYVYSGIVAASAFNQVDPDKEYENIFVIASSHRAYYNGASIYNKGNYITPLGTVKVNIELANKLIDEYDVFMYTDEAHSDEHSLEVQLPFLQYIMKKDFTIVPIVIGAQSAEASKEIAAALKPFLNTKNLFVISSDFSHYPDYENAVENDKRTALAISENSAEAFLKTIEKNKKKHISNLATSCCGWTSVASLLYMTENNQDIAIELIDYQNSGDADFGDKSRVVGYNAISFVTPETNTDFVLTREDKKELLSIARVTISRYIKNGKVPELDTTAYPESLMTHCGAFVTLHENGRLRGCIGNFSPDEPLCEVVQQMAVSASTRDYRFPKVTADEIKKLEIEISVLTPMKKIASADEIELGKHGVYIRKDHRSGTFLPQVATETGWTLEEFLGHCSRDKAGIGWDGWKDAEIFIYEANIFSEKELKTDK